MNQTDIEFAKNTGESVVLMQFVKSCLAASDAIERRRAIQRRTEELWGCGGFRSFVNALLANSVMAEGE
jgi:hypothetical protein